MSEALVRVEAAWVAVVNPLYVENLDIECKVDHNVARFEGALEMAMIYLESIYFRFKKGCVYLANTILAQTVLARRVALDKQGFDAWLAGIQQRCAAHYPRVEPYREDEVVDYSNEAVPTRSFFDLSSNVAPEKNACELDQFLRTVEERNNPFLRSKEELLARGFDGTPYRYPCMEDSNSLE